MTSNIETHIYGARAFRLLIRRDACSIPRRRPPLRLSSGVLLALLFTSIPISIQCASPGSAENEQALRDTISRMESAWARHSAADVNQFYTEDADVVIPPGNRFSGRAVLKQESEKEFAGIFKHATFAYSLKTIRYVRPDVAIVDASFEFQGSTINPAPKGLMTLVMVKETRGWLISAERAMIPIPDPTATAAKSAQ